MTQALLPPDAQVRPNLQTDWTLHNPGLQLCAAGLASARAQPTVVTFALICVRLALVIAVPMFSAHFFLYAAGIMVTGGNVIPVPAP